MPAWDDYKREARARGSLALELYAVHSVPAGSPEELKAVLPDHLAYQARLEAEGLLAFAGPLSDETGTRMQGMGLIIYRAVSFEQARRLAEDDPMHRAGARKFTLRKWMLNEGHLSLAVSLSAQTVELA